MIFIHLTKLQILNHNISTLKQLENIKNFYKLYKV